MAATEIGAWDKFKKIFIMPVISMVGEIHSLIPDSILFGSTLMYFLTQHSAYGVFAIFMIEVIIGHKILSWLSTGSTGPSRPKDDTLLDVSCRAGFKTPSYRPKRMFLHDPYPSYGMYSLSAIIAYFASAMMDYSLTLQNMDDSWKYRPFISYIFMGSVLILFFLVRLYMGCDVMGELCIAILAGIGIGFLMYRFNKTTFGIESMNFLGLPLMISKDSAGKSIYVCNPVSQ